MGWRPVHRLRKTATEDDGIPDPAFADLIDLGAHTLAAILLERAATDGDLLDRLRLTVATRLADWHGHEHHDAFMDRLREVHRRKTAFWPALAAAEQNVSRPAC
jgi:hypothetical protein